MQLKIPIAVCGTEYLGITGKSVMLTCSAFLQDRDYGLAWVWVIGYSVLFVLAASLPVVVRLLLFVVIIIIIIISNDNDNNNNNSNNSDNNNNNDNNSNDDNNNK